MGWLIALGVVTLLAVLPLGAGVRYDAAGFRAWVLLGPVKILVFPRPKKEKKEKQKKEPEQKPQAEAPAPAQTPQNPNPPPKPKKETGGKLTDFLPLVKVALELLGAFRRKLRLNNLELKLILAADDPCDLAVNYGRTWAAVGNLMPQLERLFVIKKRDVEVECDFTASEPRVLARLDLTITLGRLLALAVVYGIRALKEFWNIQKKRKGGANP